MERVRVRERILVWVGATGGGLRDEIPRKYGGSARRVPVRSGLSMKTERGAMKLLAILFTLLPSRAPIHGRSGGGRCTG
jgi:hypothetical protein